LSAFTRGRLDRSLRHPLIFPGEAIMTGSLPSDWDLIRPGAEIV
jgi:hypothetical protein